MNTEDMDQKLRQLESLAARARREAAPKTDVSAAVLRRLRQPQADPLRPLRAMAIASIAAAVLIAGIGVPSLQESVDPLGSYLEAQADVETWMSP